MIIYDHKNWHHYCAFLSKISQTCYYTRVSEFYRLKKVACRRPKSFWAEIPCDPGARACLHTCVHACAVDAQTHLDLPASPNIKPLLMHYRSL